MNVAVFLLRIVELVAPAPVIGDSIGEYLAILVEDTLGDGLVAGLAGLEGKMS